MQDNYAQETAPLFKLLRNNAFRFVIVRYNHYSFVQSLEKDLQERFPEKKLLKINAEKATYEQIFQAYLALENGILCLNNFHDVFKNETNSRGNETAIFKGNNERRKAITAGLNLRRDKLAKKKNILMVFLAASPNELYAKDIMESMPDLWSFRSLMLDFQKKVETRNESNTRELSTTEKTQTSSLGGTKNSEKEEELNRLLVKLIQTPEKETAVQNSLFPQIMELQKDLGLYQAAIQTSKDWLKIAAEKEQAFILFEQGDLLRYIGQLEAAKEVFEKVWEYEKNNKLKSNEAVIVERIADIYQNLGDLEKALRLHTESHLLRKKLYENDPENSRYKNGLAISYSKLGSVHQSLGNLEKSLIYFEEETALFKELYESYPAQVDFKNNLAISYSKLGEVHQSLGNMEKSLIYFEDYNRLEKELYESYPSQVGFKNGLAISYSKLGKIHQSSGNMEKSLFYFEEDTKLSKELYESYPSQVGFKNGLAISYANLGRLYDKMEELEKAKGCFEFAKNLWEELVRDHSAHVEFQKYFEMVKEDLSKY